MQKITGTNIDQVIAKEGLVILDFVSAWCATCESLERILEDLSADMTQPMVMAKIDIVESTEIAQKYGVMGVPTLIFLRNAEIVHRVTFSGSVSKAHLSQVIEQHFGE